MKNLILIVLLNFSCFAFSQTKLIAFKSHSGSNKNFAIAFENNLFDLDNSNLGEYKIAVSDYTNLDSVKLISKDKIVRFTSDFTTRKYKRTNQKCTDDERIKSSIDTLIIKPKSLKKGLTPLEVKSKLDSLKIYNNTLTPTLFKGFDKKSNKKNFFFFTNFNFPNKNNGFIAFIIVCSASVLVYFFTLKKLQSKIRV